jgi:hypothetical protein
VFAYETPEMPLPLSGVAAAIDATHVPCPFGSLAGLPPNADQPAPTFTSPSADDTPVSRTASFAEPVGLTDP